MGHDFVAKVEQHSSQTDAAHGFGGKFGVQKDRVDKVRGCKLDKKCQLDSMLCGGVQGGQLLNTLLFLQSALGFEHKEELKQHASQKGTEFCFIPTSKPFCEIKCFILPLALVSQFTPRYKRVISVLRHFHPKCELLVNECKERNGEMLRCLAQRMAANIGHRTRDFKSQSSPCGAL